MNQYEVINIYDRFVAVNKKSCTDGYRSIFRKIHSFAKSNIHKFLFIIISLYVKYVNKRQAVLREKRIICQCEYIIKL